MMRVAFLFFALLLFCLIYFIFALLLCIVSIDCLRVPIYENSCESKVYRERKGETSQRETTNCIRIRIIMTICYWLGAPRELRFQGIGNVDSKPMEPMLEIFALEYFRRVLPCGLIHMTD